MHNFIFALMLYVISKFRSRKANFIVHNVYSIVIIIIMRKLYESLDKQKIRLVRPDA